MRRNYESNPIKARRDRIASERWMRGEIQRESDKARHRAMRAAGQVPGLIRTAEQIEAEKTAAHEFVAG